MVRASIANRFAVGRRIAGHDPRITGRGMPPGGVAAMGISALISAWVAGMLGGAHCLAMCGGFLTAVSSAGAQSAPLVPARALALRQLPYNLGRLTTYVALGALLGAVGNASLGAIDWLPLQRTLFVAANVFLLVLGLSIAWKREGLGAGQRIGAALFARVAPIVGTLARRPGVGARYALGLVWGFVPCALVYGVLPIAMFAGSALAGGAVMLAFGLGTVPNLLAAGWLVARARTWLDQRLARFAAAALLVAFAGVGIWRALFGPLSLEPGAFCLVP